ncbi:MAG: hypothetical protein M3Y72_11480 [Acidobacteriota bacterium]|nr:hypothetical protein [Acidobacteriota bacterium]
MRQRNQERRIAQEQLQQLYARREMLDQAILSMEQKLRGRAVGLQIVHSRNFNSPGDSPAVAAAA